MRFLCYPLIPSLLLSLHTLAPADIEFVGTFQEPTAPCTFAWDPVADVIGYNLYCNDILIKFSAITQTSVDIPCLRTSAMKVTSVNPRYVESLPSEILVVLPALPQTSDSLASWESGSYFFIHNTPNNAEILQERAREMMAAEETRFGRKFLRITYPN